MNFETAKKIEEENKNILTAEKSFPFSGDQLIVRAPHFKNYEKKMSSGGSFDDGREDKSDFLARMFMMGRIEIDEKNK